MRSKNPKRNIARVPIAFGACVGTALMASTPGAFAQAESGNTVRMERLEKENADLKKRLDSLEAMAQKEGIAPSGAAPKPFVSALSGIEMSGFVTASYFHDSSTPADQKSNGYLWNTTHNSFTLNKVKLTLASKPVAKDKWDAGFRTSLIWGEDAPVVNTGSPTAGFEALREAYVQLNVPIGTGLDIKAGQLISLMNYESGDGGAVNANFSQGYQWYYTGNGPSAGVQAAYAFNDVVDFKIRVQNGMYAGPIDNNLGKCVMGAIGVKPAKDLWLSLVGFNSPENSAFNVSGGSLLAGYQATKELGLGMELDYFNFDLRAPGASAADLWSIGGWLSYDFTPKFGLALRAEYLDDKDGGGINGVGFRGGNSILSPDSDGNLASITLTANWKPVPNIKIQPEVRFDTTTYKDGFDGAESRFIVGAGASYLF
jgi:hypothetical protein